MKSQDFFYAVKPNMKRVSKEEFDNFLKNYPRRLTYDCCGIADPPSISYNDFDMANRWPYSVVARTHVYSSNPKDYYYDDDPSFYIMENYEEVFNSRTGNVAND